MNAVIDSDVLINFLQGIGAAKKEISRYDPPLYSVISWMEIMCGAQTNEQSESAKILFSSMKRVDLSPNVAEKAVEERKRQGLKFPDAIILASADVEGCILVTRNTKDFDKNDPRVRFPYSL